MQAVVLVGGEGTRLRPLTYGTPKPMVPIFGVPFLERTLARLKAAGIEEAILPAGYLPEAITDHFGDGSRIGMRLTYVIEKTPLGTAGALKNVADHITGPFFVLNGDVLTGLDLRAMIRFHEKCAGIGALHLIRVDDPSAFGCVVHDPTGRVAAFVEKPPRDSAPTDEINAGTYLLEKAVLDAIPAGRPVSIERETFPQLLAAGVPLFAYTTSDYWLDLGRPADYLQAHQDVLDGHLVLQPLADPAAHTGETWALDPGNSSARVYGPSFLGRNVVIAPDAKVGPYAVIGEGCHIEKGAIVERSILWDGVTVGSGARIAGAILASRVRVGENASIHPGAVIGHDVQIPARSGVPGEARLRVE